jgi:hypothetical protein
MSKLHGANQQDGEALGESFFESQKFGEHRFFWDCQAQGQQRAHRSSLTWRWFFQSLAGNITTCYLSIFAWPSHCFTRGYRRFFF